ncbi:MAG: tRNA pseudouridine(54/55) synthase Pus10 [Methanobacteriota archaeon]
MTTRALQAPEMLQRARTALAEGPLCPHCLGRLFGKVESGLSNPERAQTMASAIGLRPSEIRDCRLCEGLFDELPDFVALAEDAAKVWEFSTFLIGTRVAPDITEREASLHAAVGVADVAERIQSELNREIGKRLEARWGKKADVKKPDLTIVVDTQFNVTEAQVAPLYLYGRYEKFERGIPQTRWPCRRCKGRGCVECGGSGKQYPTSVQEIVEAIPIEWARAERALFHGMGREDIDARCIGTGRPFVLELKLPHVRTLDLPALERAVNEHARPRVAVKGLRASSGPEVSEIKESRSLKEYRATVRLGGPVTREKLINTLQTLGGREVEQRTPDRVLARRADLVRVRRVHSISLEAQDAESCVLAILGDAGLYVKELVSGDDGRTRPSLAELLGVSAEVTALDVTSVGAEGDDAR